MLLREPEEPVKPNEGRGLAGLGARFRMFGRPRTKPVLVAPAEVVRPTGAGVGAMITPEVYTRNQTTSSLHPPLLSCLTAEGQRQSPGACTTVNPPAGRLALPYGWRVLLLNCMRNGFGCSAYQAQQRASHLPGSYGFATEEDTVLPQPMREEAAMQPSPQQKVGLAAPANSGMSWICSFEY